MTKMLRDKKKQGTSFSLISYAISIINDIIALFCLMCPWIHSGVKTQQNLSLKYSACPNFGTSVRRSSGRCSGGRLLAMMYWPLFSLVFSIFFPPVFFPPSRPFLIEGVLGSKNLFSESCLERPKNLGVDTFPDPVGHFGAPWGPYWILQALQVVSECPLHR